MIAEIGTPCGSSQCGEIDGHCRAGAVKREFGCAAFSLLPRVQGWPCQSVRCSGTSPSMPSHHGQPSSRDRDVGEDRVARAASPSRSGWSSRRARRDAEEAGLGVDGPQAAVRTGTHPGDVVADRPDLPARLRRGRHQHGEVGLAARARERRGDVGGLAAAGSRARGSACARRASPPRAPARRRCAARSTSCRAARCRRSRSRRSRSASPRGSAG